ncbi:uncharacterized protein C8Q71DRAFT_773559 [Rhodofomes roseus]|uniref:Vanillate O-demethylase oxygenase-like C-terminal catalytic domain-containing protein n=1 Tax=Rhodofomes roseus TaxID=34475 RepID=A0ABQ8K8D7_9APHY|nr:uncharacterized protein C8Q71DRAFT_773559 [Rhodofomes roseus]KAH9833459.1 hypothetical protein C8Q71DRAFT_773559 [Rhodofomes roseus]
MQVDVEVEALSSESFRRLTSGNGFVRTWWPILKTVPEHVRQRICLNVIRMGWDILARDYSKPIGRALYEGDLLRLRLWEGEPICGFATGAAGSDQCRYIIEDVANCQWHLKSRHPAIPPIPHMSYVTAYAVPPIPQVHVDLIRKQGIVMCCSTPGFGRAPCREIMVADPAIVAAHFESQHTLSFRCSWVEPGSWRTKSCDTLLVEHSLEALLRHIVTQHIQNLPYEDLAVPQPNVPLVERACEMLAGLPRYDYT